MINKFWISTSGGIGSAISAILAHEYGIEYEMIFADTLVEDPTLYEFLRQIEVALNKKIIWLQDGRSPWGVFYGERFIGNSRIAPCSKILKTKVIKSYLKQHAIAGDMLVLGMDSSELDRIEIAQKNWAPFPVVSFLQMFRCARPKWKGMLDKYGLIVPALYDMGFPHNNCGGTCVRAGLKQWATVLDKMPDRYRLNEIAEKHALDYIGPTAKPFLKRTVRGEAEYMTLEQFRLYIEAGEIEIDPFDFGGCGCFVDDK